MTYFRDQQLAIQSLRRHGETVLRSRIGRNTSVEIVNPQWLYVTQCFLSNNALSYDSCTNLQEKVLSTEP